jgi:hypothetical protein
VVYLWLRCEGWRRFGPYDGLHFNTAHDIVTDSGKFVAYHRGNVRWRTPGPGERFLWCQPILTTAWRGPYADRVYVVHGPAAFHCQCHQILNSCEQSFAIADDGTPEARSMVLARTETEMKNGLASRRLSVYTRDEDLACELQKLGLRGADRLAYYGVHRIEDRGPLPWVSSRWPK